MADLKFEPSDVPALTRDIDHVRDCWYWKLLIRSRVISIGSFFNRKLLLCRSRHYLYMSFWELKLFGDVANFKLWFGLGTERRCISYK